MLYFFLLYFSHHVLLLNFARIGRVCAFAVSVILPDNYSIFPTSTRLSRSAKARGWSKEMLQAARLTCELVVMSMVVVSMMAVLVAVVLSIMAVLSIVVEIFRSLCWYCGVVVMVVRKLGKVQSI